MKKSMNNYLKNIIITVVIFLVLLSAICPVFAQYTNQEKIPGADQQRTEFIPYLKDILNFGFAAIGILALFMLIVGAYQYLMAAGNVGKVDSAKETIGSALLGLILGLCAWIILNKINPDLVNMRSIYQIQGNQTPGGNQAPASSTKSTSPTTNTEKAERSNIYDYP